MQQDTGRKRKASVSLTKSLERKRNKVFDDKGIIYKFGFYYALG